MTPFDKVRVAMKVCNPVNRMKNFIKKEPQPDAFAFTSVRPQVHPVVQSPERSARAHSSEAIQIWPVHNVHITWLISSDEWRKIVIRVLIHAYRAAFDEADGSSNTPVSARGQEHSGKQLTATKKCI